MNSNPQRVSAVRASRDGHEFHEAWVARKAMELLRPRSQLAGIAVEGLYPGEQAHASSVATEIADLTLYYGDRPGFTRAQRTVIAQVKYSVSRADDPFRASDAKKTTGKFSEAYREYQTDYGEKHVHDRLDFLLVTNRPIYPYLRDALSSIAKGSSPSGKAAQQAAQFQAASGLKGRALAQFAAKCRFVGHLGSLPAARQDLTGLVIDWSVGSDLQADARLGRLRQMVRSKAGSEGTNRNVITRPDVLTALGLQDKDDLLPCPAALVDVGEVIPREQLTEAVALIPRLSKPLLVHAAGGMGKTVFLESLAGAIDDHFETVFFDCFGSGAYRSPEDARHLPHQGLVHIANTLALRGMCDPILPGGSTTPSLLRTFRRRLEQAVQTVSNMVAGRGIALLVDAADNAILQARVRKEQAFPLLLLEALRERPIAGVNLILSCRSHRRPPPSLGYYDFELQPFTHAETAAFLQARIGRVSESEVRVALARSGGNPRVIEYLVSGGGRQVLEAANIDQRVELDELISRRVSQALSVAIERGHGQADIDAFLAGLAVLPPPVPVADYANAQGLDTSEVESFASDLWPLLERTNQGLLFRDEPTETLVRERFATRPEVLRQVADRLFDQQGVSVYAARALPGLLQQLGEGEQLFQLAFDERIPSSITSTVGKRSIRYGRIRAAALHAAREQDFDRLTELLVELSTVAAVDQRGADYVVDNPDLVVAAKDADAIRRLFEVRSGWPGSRHARLAIANVLSGDVDEAYRHAHAAEDWIRHYLRTELAERDPKSGPEHLDIAAIPFLLISQGRAEHAVAFMKGWRDWYSYEVSEHVVRLSVLAQNLGIQSTNDFDHFLESSKGDIGCLAACLSFAVAPHAKREALVEALARACRRERDVRLRKSFASGPTYRLEDGLRKAAAIALSHGHAREAMVISLRAPHQRPNLWSFRDVYYDGAAFPFVFRQALRAAAGGAQLHEKDVIPTELVKMCSRIPRKVSGEAFRIKAKKKLSEVPRRSTDSGDEKAALSYDQRQTAERFLAHRLEPLLAVTRALSHVLAADESKINSRFNDLLDSWERARRPRGPYSSHELDAFFAAFGLDCATFVLWARDGIRAALVEKFLNLTRAQGVSAARYVQLVSILAKRPEHVTLAGEQALRARSVIQAETDVSYRAALFAALGRAIMPASVEEAAVYFHAGLEQMDAIGAGDHEFANELLLFASSMSGDEVEARDFHTLTNICELNLPDEAEKFPWGNFATGLAKAAGIRGLAKLSRWDDRDRISLSYTLLPYLTALVEGGKLEPIDAVALNRLASPAELYGFGTDVFTNAVHEIGAAPTVLAELASQFQDNNRGPWIPSSADTLASILKSHEQESETAAYLAQVRKLAAAAAEKRNEQRNQPATWRTAQDSSGRCDEDETRAKLQEIVAATDPADGASLQAAVEMVKAIAYPHNSAGRFFAEIRDTVPFRDRTHYIRRICALPNLDLRSKIAEMEACAERWRESTGALNVTYASQAVPLLQQHAEELLGYGGLSRRTLQQISSLTGVSVPALALELVKRFATRGSDISGATWLSLASMISPETSTGLGQTALTRLLRTDAAELAHSVQDGRWEEGLYPHEDGPEIAAGLIWRRLGSPYAAHRWLAAHCLRCFAGFDRWEIVDAVVARAENDHALPFQAKELVFYSFHARLWLLIALARLALDYPDRIAPHKKVLLNHVAETDRPHVLMRHFAACALLACADQKTISMPPSVEQMLRTANKSKEETVDTDVRQRGGFYSGRPESAPEPEYTFYLDYDFAKYDVDSLRGVFGKPIWELRDMLAAIINGIDPDVGSMHESGGRESPFRRGAYGMRPEWHTYGQQLGWHALFLCAAQLLRDAPITRDRRYEEDPWGEWLGRRCLSRRDGRWLSDGMDRRPPRTFVNLLEPTDRGLGITGDKQMMLGLAWLTESVGNEVAVDASWKSVDGIEVSVSSALVAPSKSAELAKQLTDEEPFFVWLPNLVEGDDEAEHVDHERKGFQPWVVIPSRVARLDEHDPLASPVANARPKIAAHLAARLSLRAADAFGRVWVDQRDEVALRALAWGRESQHPYHNDSDSGTALLASDWIIRDILTSTERHLLLLISLRRYESGRAGEDARFSHTVSVVRIDDSLNLQYFKGRVDHVHPTQS